MIVPHWGCMPLSMYRYKTKKLPGLWVAFLWLLTAIFLLVAESWVITTAEANSLLVRDSGASLSLGKAVSPLY